MRCRSLGLRRDVAMLELGGSLVEDRGDHLVVRSPHNPGHWWGNFLIARTGFADAERWDTAYLSAFPDSSHVAIALDEDAPLGAELRLQWVRSNLLYSPYVALTAATVADAAHRHPTAVCRPLTSDDDWNQSLALQTANYEREDRESYRAFLVAAATTMRGLVDAGRGQWFGAFVDGRMRCGMGVFLIGEGSATVESVDTDPQARRQALAGTLLVHAARWALDQAGVRRLIVVTDAMGDGIRLYRSMEFVDAALVHQFDRNREP